MSAREWTEIITSSPAVVSVFDGISESAAQALCEAIEQEIAPLAAQRDDLLAALKTLLHADAHGTARQLDAERAAARAAIARAEGKS